MTVEESGAVMDVLTVAYPSFYARQTDDEKYTAAQLWAGMFESYPVKLVLGAVKAFIATDAKGFPPSIGAIMEKVRKITEPEEMTEVEAWSLVSKALRNSIYGSKEEFAKLPPEIQSVLGDPSTLRAWAMDDSYNESVVSSNFMRSYRARAASVREFKALPADVRQMALDMGSGLKLEWDADRVQYLTEPKLEVSHD